MSDSCGIIKMVEVLDVLTKVATETVYSLEDFSDALKLYDSMKMNKIGISGHEAGESLKIEMIKQKNSDNFIHYMKKGETAEMELGHRYYKIDTSTGDATLTMPHADIGGIQVRINKTTNTSKMKICVAPKPIRKHNPRGR